MDGLTPELLKAYLSTSTEAHTRGALYRLLHVDQARRDSLTMEAGILADRAVSILPTLAAPVSATLVTGVPPRLHRVRFDSGVLSSDVTTVYEIIARENERSVNAGFPFGRGASFEVLGSDDSSRVAALVDFLAHAPQKPALVTLQLNGLARALSADTWSGTMDALSAADNLLHDVLYGEGNFAGDDTVVLITAAQGALRLTADANGSAFKDIYDKFGPSRLNVMGGAAWVRDVNSVDHPETIKPPPNSIVVTVNRNAARVLDEQLEGWRPFTQFEKVEYPDIERRIRGWLDEGDVVYLLGNRVRPYAEFTRTIAASGRLAVGGGSAGESLVAFLMAGEPLRQANVGGLKSVQLEQVAATVVDLLGISIPRGMSESVLNQLETRETNASGALEQTEGASNKFDSQGGRCRDASLKGTGIVEPCTQVLQTTRDRTAAAEALLALTVDAVESNRTPIAARSVERAIKLAAWLAPNAIWPRSDGGLKRLWPQATPKCESSGGIVVLLDPEDEKAAIAATTVLRELSTSAALLNQEREASVKWCQFAVPMGDGEIGDVQAAELIVRFLGAQLLLWGDASNPSTVNITVSSPLLNGWLGPTAFTESVADGEFPTSSQGQRGAETVAKVTTYLHFVRGISAFHAGNLPQAAEHFRQASKLPPVAASWRDAFWSYTASKEDLPSLFEKRGSASQDPKVKWPTLIRDLLRRLRVHDDFDNAATAISEGHVFFSISPPYTALVEDLALWPSIQKDFLAALGTTTPIARGKSGEQASPGFANYARDPDNACLMQQNSGMGAPVSDRAAALERIGNPGLSALVRLRDLAEHLNEDFDAHSADAILALLTQESAGWVRLNASYILASLLERLKAPGPSPATTNRTDEVFLSSLENDILQDTITGFQARNALRAYLLLVGPGFRNPEKGRWLIGEIVSRQSEGLLTTLFRNAWNESNVPFFVVQMVQPRGLITLVESIDKLLQFERSQSQRQESEEDKVARALAHLFRATTELGAGRPQVAAAELELAELTGNNAAVMDRRNAARATKGGETHLETMEPWVRIMQRLIQSWILEQYQKDAKTARARFAEALDLLMRLLSVEAGSDPDWQQQLSRAQTVIESTVGAMIDAGVKGVADPFSDPAAAKAASALHIAPTSQPATKSVSRLLTLASVGMRDYIFSNALDNSVTDAHLKMLEGATTDMLALTENWKGDLDPDSRRLLFLGMAVQSFLKVIPAIIKDGRDPTAILANTDGAVGRQLQSLADKLAAQYPDEEIGRRLLYDDDVRLVSLDLIRTALESITSQVRKYGRADKERLMQSFVTQLDKRLKELDPTKPSDVAMALTYLEDSFSSNEKEMLEALKTIQSRRAGTAFAGHEYLWPALSFDPLMKQGLTSEAAQALDTLRKRCPPLANEAELGAMRLEAASRNWARAQEALDRYASGADRGNMSFGWLGMFLTVGARNMFLRYDTAHSLGGILLGDSFAYSKLEASLVKADKLRIPAPAQLFAEKAGQPSDAAETALMLKAWIAMKAGDDASLGRLLVSLVESSKERTNEGATDLLTDFDRRFNPYARTLFEPRMFFWIATLAELRGFRALAEEMMQFVASDLSENPEIIFKGVPGAGQASGARYWFDFSCLRDDGDSSTLEKLVECDPSMLLWENRLGPYRQLAVLRARRFVGKFVSEKDWGDAVEAVRKLDSAILPAWALQVDRAWRSDASVSAVSGVPAAIVGLRQASLAIPNAIVAAGETPYACEAVWIALYQLTQRVPELKQLADHCGDTRLLVEALLQDRFLTGRHVIDSLKDIIRITEAITRSVSAEVSHAELESQALSLLRRLTPDMLAEAELAADLRELAERARALGLTQFSLALRTCALASEIKTGAGPSESPQNIFEDRQRASLRPDKYSNLLVRLAFRNPGPDEAVKLVDQFLQ
jgi:hypothetical protein